MPNPFRIFEEAFREFDREELSATEKADIKARVEKEAVEEMDKEVGEMAKALPMMLDKFEEAGVHKSLAKFLYQFYAELKAAGFTDDQAIKIAASNFNIDGDSPE